jgi:hypothetical protein
MKIIVYTLFFSMVRSYGSSNVYERKFQSQGVILVASILGRLPVVLVDEIGTIQLISFHSMCSRAGTFLPVERPATRNQMQQTAANGGTSTLGTETGLKPVAV